MNSSAAVMAQLRTNRIEPNLGRVLRFFSFFLLKWDCTKR